MRALVKQKIVSRVGILTKSDFESHAGASRLATVLQTKVGGKLQPHAITTWREQVVYTHSFIIIWYKRLLFCVSFCNTSLQQSKNRVTVLSLNWSWQAVHWIPQWSTQAYLLIKLHYKLATLFTFFSAWPCHLARQAFAISKWLCSFYLHIYH